VEGNEPLGFIIYWEICLVAKQLAASQELSYIELVSAVK
jgi:hypothetical protein